MSSKKAFEAALKVLKEKHKKKYNAPLGKRRCSKNLSDDCLGLASEDLFRGSICADCRRCQLQGWYGKRIEREVDLKREVARRRKILKKNHLNQKKSKCLRRSLCERVAGQGPNAINNS